MNTPKHSNTPDRLHDLTQSRCGFTLIELLAVVAIIGILGSIIYAVGNRAYISSQKAVSMSGLRDVGMAMAMYTQENDGYLPGPLYGGQSARYAQDDRMLGYHLWSYLELPEPSNSRQPFPPLTCPLFDDLTDDAAPAYFMQQTVAMPAGNRNPWGYRRADQTEDEGSKPQLINLIQMANNENTWAMRAADAGSNNSPQAGWADKLLPEPLYSGERLHLYYDWHVEFVPVD
ncbi:type II secretion system protein [Cerasicoccus frondis]|uniref:type II secretion system protein n=1 Tax=Cerasicoccus frondis TaxID=490090 RepID=UPI0028525DB7|nr:type II secretion system protein [Cerasicoccus frondis]